MFIRTTCSKILLPPGIYKYARNNGLQSIMSVKADKGTFDAIESHYHIMDRRTAKIAKLETKTESKCQNGGSGPRKASLPHTTSLSPMHVFSNRLKEKVGPKA